MIVLAQRYGLDFTVADFLTKRSYIGPEIIQYVASALDAPPHEWESLLEGAGLTDEDAHTLVGILLESS